MYTRLQVSSLCGADVLRGMTRVPYPLGPRLLLLTHTASHLLPRTRLIRTHTAYVVHAWSSYSTLCRAAATRLEAATVRPCVSGAPAVTRSRRGLVSQHMGGHPIQRASPAGSREQEAGSTRPGSIKQRTNSPRPPLSHRASRADRRPPPPPPPRPRHRPPSARPPPRRSSSARARLRPRPQSSPPRCSRTAR